MPAENLAGRTIATYRLLERIGEGGTATVYRAEHPERGQCAVKILRQRSRSDPVAVKRFLREAGYGARVQHANVVSTYEYGEEDSLYYLALEWAEGESLADYAQRNGPLAPGVVAPIISQLAGALAAAHAEGIIHRDLKPENIMICKRADGTEYAVVMDFGLAKERKAGGELQKLTATGIILGTPEFMSPEQLRGKTLDLRTDVYSLALMTYEMLTGKLPFEGRNQQEMMIARLRSDPIPAKNRRPELPDAVDAVLLKAMARAPEDRYQSAPEFAKAFRAAAG